MTTIRRLPSKSSLNGDDGIDNGVPTTPKSSSTSFSTTITPPIKYNHRLPNLLQVIRIVLATIYLVLIVLTIPLSFELGGVNCGLSFTFTILVLYFVLTTLRVWKFNRTISSFLYYSQHLLLPTLLFLFISLFSNSDYHLYGDENILEKLWWNVIIKSWKFFLINSTPLFTILEGFCSLLLIQSIGQTSKWLTKHKSETWSIVSLLSSGIIITLATFFLFKIYKSPINITNIGLISLSLLGSILTFTLVVTLFGLLMGKSTTIECSLIFAYIVKCIYEIFPELSQLNYDNFQDLIKFILDELYKINEGAKNKNWFLINNENQLNKLGSLIFKYNEDGSNSITNFYKLVLKFITKNFPSSFQTLWDFLKLSVVNLTIPILINLFYRIGVFFALTKIIPILQPLSYSNSPNRSPSQSQQSSPKLSPVSSSLSSSSPHHHHNHHQQQLKQQSNINHLSELPSHSSLHSMKDSDDDDDSISISTFSSTPTTSLETLSQTSTKLGSVAPIKTATTTTLSSSSSFNTRSPLLPTLPPSKTTRLIYLYSPCIIITVYTNLMIQYNNRIDDIPLINWLVRDFLTDGVHIWQFWHWVNVFLFLMLYTIELVLN